MTISDRVPVWAKYMVRDGDIFTFFQNKPYRDQGVWRTRYGKIKMGCFVLPKKYMRMKGGLIRL